MSNIINNVILQLFGKSLRNDEYDFISDFTFLWSVFENKLRKNDDSLNLKRLVHIINSPLLKVFKQNFKSMSFVPELIIIEISNDNFTISISNIDYKITLLPIEREIELQWLKTRFDELENINQNDKRIVLLFSYITYRLRNNLFHGNKNFSELHKQKDLFKLVNTFMETFLIETKNIEF